MKEYRKKQLKKIRIALILDSKKRTNYIVKNKIFKEVGENFFFQPRIIPADPELIKFHNNVTVTSNVTFVTHDIFYEGLNRLNKGTFYYYSNCIEVMDNVFIGCNSTILPGIKIGPNSVIGAGSVVTKDVKPNTVVAGNPAKVIGTFDDFIKKRKELPNILNESDLWDKFNKEKNKEID